MIEIVYDKTTAEKNGKNEMHYKMPKNIRQIGNAPDKKKIYIEDYAFTYINSIAYNNPMIEQASNSSSSVEQLK